MTSLIGLLRPSVGLRGCPLGAVQVVAVASRDHLLSVSPDLPVHTKRLRVSSAPGRTQKLKNSTGLRTPLLGRAEQSYRRVRTSNC